MQINPDQVADLTTFVEDIVGGMSLPGGGSSGVDDPTSFTDAYGSALTSFSDQEFARSGSPTSPPSGWTLVTGGSPSYVERLSSAIIRPATSGTPETHHLLVATMPSESTWAAYAKVVNNSFTGNWQRGGLVLRDSVSGKYVQFGYAYGDGAVKIHLNRWSALSTFSSGAPSVEGQINRVPTYFRIRRNTATSWDFLYSFDGIGWTEWALGLDMTGFFTPNQVGIIAATPHSTLRGAVVCDWIRARAA